MIYSLTEKAKIIWKDESIKLKRMLEFIKGYRKECVIAPLFKLLEAVFDLLVPLVMASVIDTGIENGDRSFIISRCGILVILALVGLACSITAQFFASKAAVGYASGLRHSLFKHIQTLSFSDMDTIGTSTLITRMTSDVNQLQTGINLFLRLFLRSPFIVFGSMIMAFSINTRAALVFAVLIPVLAAVVIGLMIFSTPLYRQVQTRLDSFLGAVRENLSGARVIRAFCREAEETEQLEQASGALARFQLFAGRVSSLMNPVTYVIVDLGIIAVLFSGAVRVNSGEMQQGDVIAMVSYMTQILVELVKLANLVVQITKSIACAGRINSVLEMTAQLSYPEAPAQRSSPGEAVRFDNVSFTYPGAAQESLSDISFTAYSGQTIGIIGGTGSGKSTLISLIPRFYDAVSGEVALFGTSVSEYTKKQLTDMVSVVMQKINLFKGTVRSNLTWGCPDADDSVLWEALENAQAAEFIRGIPGGLDAPVEQGGKNFSGGQRQRLTIARALVSRPDILILDDSTSALDFATDAALRRAIASLPGNITIFIVSQRTASISHSDKIIVLDDGRMVGCGTHSELLEQCTVYREIYDSQFRKEGDSQ